MQYPHLPIFCSALLSVSLLMSTDAEALDRNRIDVSGPTNYCQAALPVFEGNIRKRPLAVQNEGTSNAFVTCSFQTRLFTSTDEVTEIELYVGNSNSTATDITCTAVGGFQGGALQLDTRETTLDPGEIDSFTYNDFQYNNDILPSPFSVSCNLLPGMAIHEAYIFRTEDVGD